MNPRTGKFPHELATGDVDAFEFGPFRLDLRQQMLTRSGEHVKLPRKTLELLTFLVRNNGKTIDKATLMDTVWEGAFVEDANLTVHISRLRKIFSADDPPAATIETFPKVGYRFSADLQIARPTEAPAQIERPIAANDVGSESGNGFADHAASSEASDGVRDVRFNRWVRLVTMVLVIAVVVFGSGYLLREWYGKPGDSGPTVMRVPGTEQSTSIAFSPNGEYIAHSVSIAGKRTLTITHVNSGSSLPLLPTDDSSYGGLTFTRDSSFLYYVKVGPEFNTLYKIPILGGTPTRIIDRVDNRVSFSPDGSRFCFVRKLPDGVTAIMTANADGTDEREISRRTAPQFYSAFEISWSPDGKLIANAAGSSGDSPSIQLVGVEVESGNEVVISDRKWAGVDGLEWMRDGSGLVAGMFEGPATPTYVWFIPFPAGRPRRITNDLENYGSVGVSADGTTIMAGQFKDNTSLWIVPPGEPTRAEPLRTGKHHKFNWVRWTPDGGFVFGSDAGGNRDVWRMNMDGTGEKVLTAGPQSNVMPVATADGSYIIFAAFRDNNGLFELWRMNPDGSDQVQLTPSGGGAWQPSLSPDGQWVFYTSGKMDGPPVSRRIWKVPVEGGEPVLFLGRIAYQADVSPDGKYLACWIRSDEKAKPQAAIFTNDGGDPVKIFDGPVGNRLDWTPDGNGLSYIMTEDGVSNVWTQPLDGGPPRRETQFTSETIRNFEWARDGRLMVSRYHKTRDVMLIRNFR